MNKGKKLLSQTASVMMCLAMAGTSVAGVLPVWATGQDGDASDIQVMTDNKPSATLLNALSDGIVALDDEVDDGVLDFDENAGIDYLEKYWLRNGTDMRQVNGTDSVMQVMKDLFLSNLSDEAFSHLKLDVVTFDRFNDDDDGVGLRRNLPLDATINNVYSIFYTLGEVELVLYDETEQFMRVRLDWNPNSVSPGVGAVEVVDGTLKEGNEYDGIQKIVFEVGSGKMNPSNAVLWRDSIDTFGWAFPEVSHDTLSFRGWYTEPDGGGIYLMSSTQISQMSKNSAGELVAYAYYSEPVVKITFDMQGFTTDPEPIEVYKGKPIKETPDIVFPDSCDDEDVESIFDGWYTEPDGQGTKITADSTLTEDTTLYAYFINDESTYRVNFDANGGEVYGNSVKEILCNTAIGSDVPSATRDHYVFNGWYTEKTGGTKLTPTTVIDGDKTYYAQWSAERYTLTFDVGQGSMTGSDLSTTKTYAYGESIPSLPGASLTGHSFEGWYTEPNGEGTKISVGSQLAEHTTVFAYFKEVVFNKTITFNANGGTVSEATRVRAEGANVGDLPTPSRTGYVFDGWFTALNGGYEVTASYKVTADVTFYAHWTRSANPVTSVTINKVNGTVVSGSNKSYTMDISDPLQIEYGYAPAAADNAVFHWSSSNESVIRISGDNLVLVGGGTTTLTIQTSDGSKSDSITITVNAPKVLVTNLYFDNPEQTISGADGLDLGFKFGPVNAENAKWKWSSSDSEILEIAEDGSSFKLGGKLGDVTITLSTIDDVKSTQMLVHVIDPDDDDNNPPEEIEHTITFQTHGGKAVAPVKVASGGDVKTLPTTEKAGYTFDGWALANGTRVVGLENVTSDIVLYAQWIENEEPDEELIVVTFESMNGVAAVKQNVAPGSSLASLPTPTRDGYRFLGWFTVASQEGGVEVTTSTVFDEDITVYARWENIATADKYTLVLDANGGLINGKSGLTRLDTPLEANKGVWNSIESFVATRPGYTFNGWADENGTLVYDVNGEAVYGTAYWKDSDTYIGGDLTVYAQWMKNATKYELRYDTRGGNDVHPVFYEEGSVITNFVTPVNPGYIFDGWFTDVTFKTLVTELTMDKDYTIYAKWTKEVTESPLQVYTVTFDSQGGSEIEPVKALEGTASELQTPVYAGHTFEGWFTEPEGGMRLTSLMVSRDMTLYAHWTEDAEKVVKTTITFDYNYEPTSTRKVTATAGTELATLPIAARHGYVFDGWYDTPVEGEGEPYKTYTVGDEADTLYAHWTTDKNVSDDDEVMFTLTFESESGTYVDPITAPEGELITSLPVSEREGYVFEGWFTDPSESGDKVDTIELHTNATLYAHWREATAADEVWEVTLDDGVNTPHTWALNTDVAFSAFTTPVLEGYTFVGWFTEKDGGVQVSGSYAYTGDKDVTFYAHWEECSAGTPENPDETEKPDTPVTPGGDENTPGTDDDNQVTEKKVEYINLSQNELTKKMGEDLGLSFTYGPKGAVNAKFVWSSSNEDVMTVITNEDGGQTLKYVAPGKTTLTVSTEDGSVSDSCELTVLDKDGNPAEAAEYTLNVTKPDGSVVKTYVKEFATLDKLFTKLGLTVANWGVDGSDAKVSGDTTMGELVELIGGKTIVLKAMDSDGKVIGDIEIAKAVGEDTYDVKITLGDTQSGDDVQNPDDSNNDDNNDTNNSGSDSQKPGNDSNSGNNGNNDNNSNNSNNNSGNTNNGNNANNGSSDDNNGSGNASQNEVRTLNLTVISVTGTTSNVKIQSNKTLDELAKALGYDNVAKWALKQANISEYGINGTMSMASLAELIEKNGDLAVLAYDADGSLIGCAKVVADGEDAYKVSLSKDANVALRSAKEIADNGDVSDDSKGKEDDKNTVTKDGKSDSTAPSVKTAYARTLPLYGALGSVTVLLLGVVTFLKKKLRRV